MKLSLSTATSSRPGLPVICRTVVDPSDMMTGSDLSASPKIPNAHWQCRSHLSLVIGGNLPWAGGFDFAM